MTVEMRHAPGCGPHEGTVTSIGHSVTVTRCTRCAAVITERLVHQPPIPRSADPDAAS